MTQFSDLGLAATLMSALRTEGYEMHKALGIATHESAVEIPILPNDQDTVALAALVARRIGPRVAVPGFLLAGHGLYAWGSTAADARRHVEALEFLLACHLEERRLR